MIITKSLMQCWFNEFNRIYFNNELPEPILRSSKALKNALGRFTYISNIYTKKTYKWTIILSSFYDREEKHLKETMLHEMIHEFTMYKYREVGHGKTFLKECKRLSQFGWEIKPVINLFIELGAEKYGKYMDLQIHGDTKQDRWVVVIPHDEYDFVCCIPKKYGISSSVKSRKNYRVYDMKEKAIFDRFPNTGTGSRLKGKKIQRKDDIHKVIFSNLIDLK